MDKILSGTGAMVYLDDIIVPGRGTTDHDSRLRCVLKTLQDAGFILRLDKCTFGCPSHTLEKWLMLTELTCSLMPTVWFGHCREQHSQTRTWNGLLRNVNTSSER